MSFSTFWPREWTIWVGDPEIKVSCPCWCKSNLGNGHQDLSSMDPTSQLQIQHELTWVHDIAWKKYYLYIHQHLTEMWHFLSFRSKATNQISFSRTCDFVKNKNPQLFISYWQIAQYIIMFNITSEKIVVINHTILLFSAFIK